jgi:peptidoglycan/LPS O-acetylase OafA/YrhL
LLAAVVIVWLLFQTRGANRPFALVKGYFFFAGASTALLITGFMIGKIDFPKKALSWTPLTSVGKISYGLYLYHLPIYCLMPWPIFTQLPRWSSVGLVVAIAIGLSFAAAIASYYLVEVKFQLLKERLGKQSTSSCAN